jgi:hypothetical protein
VRAARLSKLDQWLATHNGVVSRHVLVRIGFTHGAIRHLLAQGSLEHWLPGVFRSSSHPHTRAQTLTAVCLYSPAAIIGFTTAGQELGLRRMSDPRIHVLMPHRVRLEIPGVSVHRCRQIDPVDITTTRADGVRLTSPPRTLLDAASIVERDELESAIEHALAERMCSIGTLLNTSVRLYHPRRPGAARFRDALRARPVWRQAARSDLEVRFRRAIEAHGLPEPLVNVPLELAPGEVLEVDLAWPEVRVVGEVDHPFWHDGTLERHRDRKRDRRLAAHGWLPMRFDERDIELGLDDALGDLEAVLVERGWRPMPRQAS